MEVYKGGGMWVYWSGATFVLDFTSSAFLPNFQGVDEMRQLVEHCLEEEEGAPQEVSIGPEKTPGCYLEVRGDHGGQNELYWLASQQAFSLRVDPEDLSREDLLAIAAAPRVSLYTGTRGTLVSKAGTTLRITTWPGKANDIIVMNAVTVVGNKSFDLLITDYNDSMSVDTTATNCAKVSAPFVEPENVGCSS
ncbi:MAG: hypothetical protein ACREJP_03790, partial [Candidatus Methylomirabilales bacterium]